MRMSMLNDEQKAALMNQVVIDTAPSEAAAVEVAVPDVKPEQSSTQQEEKSVTVEAEAPAPPTEVEIDDSSPEVHKGHRVPYNRFKTVLDARNKFRSDVDGYQSKISSLEEKLIALQKSQAQTPSAPPAIQEQEERSWLDDYLGQGGEAAAPEWQQQYSSLDQRLYQFEVAQEEDNLRAELGKIKEQFPNVPQKMLLKAVIKDPDVDIFRMASDYTAYVSGIEEGAIARYLEGQGGQPIAAAPEAPPRPRTTPSTSSGTVIKPNKKPSSVKEASNALRNMLKKDNIFKT